VDHAVPRSLAGRSMLRSYGKIQKSRRDTFGRLSAGAGATQFTGLNELRLSIRPSRASVKYMR